uniref:Uncharacterized protein n=1 Tax=Sphaerodactylus townsendi TaxID=933632 RepID=A0ACB8G0E8_9SAUR
MALLLDSEFKVLPADKQIETAPFLEAVSHLPPFFGVCGSRCLFRARSGLYFLFRDGFCMPAKGMERQLGGFQTQPEELGQAVERQRLRNEIAALSNKKHAFKVDWGNVGVGAVVSILGSSCALPISLPPFATWPSYSTKATLRALSGTASCGHFCRWLSGHQSKHAAFKTFSKDLTVLQAAVRCGGDCLGTPIMYAPVKADLSGNIKGLARLEEQFKAPMLFLVLFQKIRAVYETNPEKFRTLQNILEAEKEMHGSAWPKVGATLALMWLKRGLKFIQVLMQSLCDGERDEDNPNLIRVNATKAYEMALQKYHGWILQKLFLGSVYALPYKSDLLKALEKGREVKEEETLEKIHQFLTKVTPILDAIYEMYTKMNAELNYKA